MLENEVNQCIIETLNIIRNDLNLNLDINTINSIDTMIDDLKNPTKPSIAKMSTEDKYETLEGFFAIYDMDRTLNVKDLSSEPIIDYARDFPYILNEIIERYPDIKKFFVKIQKCEDIPPDIVSINVIQEGNVHEAIKNSHSRTKAVMCIDDFTACLVKPIEGLTNKNKNDPGLGE